MTEERLDFSLVPKPLMDAIEKSAALPEEAKERERPHYRELRAALDKCPSGDMYTFLGGMLLGGLYKNPSDPFAAVYQTIGVPQDELRQGIDQKLRQISQAFFPMIGRQDLVTKYELQR